MCQSPSLRKFPVTNTQVSLDMEDRKGGILEVILVSARGIRKKDFIGKSSGYYVVIQCGNQIHRSRISSGEERKAIWNQKFTFKFPNNSSWEDMRHLHLKILDTETFSEDNFIGEAIIHLGGILTEGNENGLIELKPTPYNVVLEDDTYKGQIKIGLKFISDAIGDENQWLERDFFIAKKLSAWAIYKMITNLWRIPRWKTFFFCNRPKVSAIQKD